MKNYKKCYDQCCSHNITSWEHKTTAYTSQLFPDVLVITDGFYVFELVLNLLVCLNSDAVCAI